MINVKKNQPISEIVQEVFQKKHDLSQDLINNLISVLIPSTTEDIQFDPKLNSLLQSPLVFSRDLQEINSHTSEDSLWKIVFGQNEVTFWKNTENITKFSLEIQEKSGSKKEKLDESQTEILKSFLLSVTSLLEESPINSAESMDNFFGRNSPFFVYFDWCLQNFLEENQKGAKIYLEQYNHWKESLKLHYDENNLTQKFYNIHLYYLLLTFELFKTYNSTSLVRKEHNEEDIQLIFYKIFPEIKKLSFYSWWIEVLPDSHFWLENINLNPLFTNPESIKGDIFHQLYQKIVTPNIRHNLGEFYTPPNLARKIVDKEYQFGQYIMDPACGSGIFLIEITLKILQNREYSDQAKIQAIQHIFGFDINPIATITSKLNLIFLLPPQYFRIISESFHIYHENLLFIDLGGEDFSSLMHTMDVVIGNPAWLTLKNLHNLEYKKQLKGIATDLRIRPKGHQAPNLEISALFFYKCQDFLKPGGSIGFIVSKAFISGSNHNLTRNYYHFDQVHMWTFTSDLFNIANICLFAKYNPHIDRNEEKLKRLKIPRKIVEIGSSQGRISFDFIKEDILVPYTIGKQGDQFLVGKLISQEELQQLDLLLPHGHNNYKEKCHRGVDIFPRSLTAVIPHVTPEGKPYIIPRKNQSKSPWNFDLFAKLKDFPNIVTHDKIFVELDYIFPVLKSKHLVPFGYLFWDYAFIPIDFDDESQRYELINKEKSRAWNYLQALESIFSQNHKRSAAIQTLWARLNYQQNLVNPRHQDPFKVVYQRSGSYVRACLVKHQRVFIDTTNYLLTFHDEDEAYYVMAFLNAPDMTKAIQIEKSARDIHKLPFTFALPGYDPSNSLHQKVIQLTKEMEKKVTMLTERIIKTFLEKNQAELMQNGWFNIEILQNLKPRQIQNQIYNKLGWNIRSNEIIKEYARLNTLIHEIVEEK
ncbi:MAG: N-6 DNA methylase [Promethearchaeota archaeon]